MSADAFDVVVPTLPGYGFSSPLTTPGINFWRTADLWVSLMRGVLSYDKFAAGGGKLLWEYEPKVFEHAGDRLRVMWDSYRGPAFYKGTLIISTVDGRLVALAAKTGKMLWETMTIDPRRSYYRRHHRASPSRRTSRINGLRSWYFTAAVRHRIDHHARFHRERSCRFGPTLGRVSNVSQNNRHVVIGIRVRVPGRGSRTQRRVQSVSRTSSGGPRRASSRSVMKLPYGFITTPGRAFGAVWLRRLSQHSSVLLRSNATGRNFYEGENSRFHSGRR